EVTSAATLTAGTAPARQQAPASSGISAETLADRVGAFLGQRGFAPTGTSGPVPPSAPSPAQPAVASSPLTFVCEEDVRRAIQKGQKLVVAERAIITPSARELGEAHKVLTM